MIDDRNLLVHTYNEVLSQQIYSHLKEYEKLFNKITRITEEES